MTKNSHILRLREYESASIGSEWDSSRKIVPPYVVGELERLQAEQPRALVKISRRSIKGQNFVGVIGVGDRAIEILPKTDEADDATRRRLIQMMTLTGIIPHLDAGTADLASSVSSFLDAFMQAYTRQLAIEWRRGRTCGYEKTDENRSYLRGKLLFQQQIRINRMRPERFFTRADQFITDVPQSRLLKAGLDVCRRFGIADTTRRRATTLLAEFDDVSNHSFTDAELDAVKSDRRIARFEPLLTLAKRLVRGEVPDRRGVAATYSLLFDMNVIFERYIGCVLRQVCPSPYRVQLQLTGRSLVMRDGKQKFFLRPDVAIRSGSNIPILIDTKWKLLDPAKPHEGVRQSDMYQAYAYAKEYSCRHVILLYPRFGKLASRVASYRLHAETSNSPRVEINTVDISQPPSQLGGDLLQIITSALDYES